MQVEGQPPNIKSDFYRMSNTGNRKLTVRGLAKVPGKSQAQKASIIRGEFHKTRNLDYIGSTPIKCAKVLAMIKDGDFRPCFI